MSLIRHLLTNLVLTPNERTLLANLRKLDKGEQQFFQRAIDAMAHRHA